MKMSTVDRRTFMTGGAAVLAAMALGHSVQADDTGGMGNMDMSGMNMPSSDTGDRPIFVRVVDDGQAKSDRWAVMISQAEFKAGEAYPFEIANAGTMSHELMFMTRAASDDMAAMMASMPGMPMNDDGPGIIAVAEAANLAKAGDVAQLSVTFPEPGEYVLGCHMMVNINGLMCDHFANGMHISVMVTA
jgi:uncharacterized cupredoxin-like copper-binding protein